MWRVLSIFNNMESINAPLLIKAKTIIPQNSGDVSIPLNFHIHTVHPQYPCLCPCHVHALVLVHVSVSVIISIGVQLRVRIQVQFNGILNLKMPFCINPTHTDMKDT